MHLLPVSVISRRLMTGLLAVCLLTPAVPAQHAPEPAAAATSKTLVTAGHHMVVAANPLAADAGRTMLRRGGNAVDAAIATQLVLGLVEPQSSGLGGGAFMVVAAPGGQVTTYDGRETAGAAVTDRLFLKPDGSAMAFPDTLPQGRAVGVPGVVALLAQAHAAHGKLPWATLFEPAIALADAGVPAWPRMVGVLTDWQRMLGKAPDLVHTYYRDGAGPPALGERLPMNEQAQSLRLLAAAGPDMFYRGPYPARATQGTVPPGNPPFRTGARFPAADGPDIPSTSHFSIIDDDGQVVSMTTSVEFAFGSGLMAGGFVLNNQMTDFTFVPTKDGKPIANAPAAGKRPRSSMAPMVVFDATGKPVIAVGSPGGTAIIGYVAETLVAMLDWGLDPQEAVDLPIVQNRNGPTLVENVADADTLAAALTAMGHTVKREGMNSGIHALRVTATGIHGGADPRRDGAALGD